MSTSIETKGTFPIFKYDLKKSGWIATVFIDDQGGDTPSWEIFYKLQGPEIYWDEFISEEGISPL